MADGRAQAARRRRRPRRHRRGRPRRAGGPAGRHGLPRAAPSATRSTPCTIRLPGDRERIREFATISLLDLLRRRLLAPARRRRDDRRRPPGPRADHGDAARSCTRCTGTGPVAATCGLWVADLSRSTTLLAGRGRGRRRARSRPASAPRPRSSSPPERSTPASATPRLGPSACSRTAVAEGLRHRPRSTCGCGDSGDVLPTLDADPARPAPDRRRARFPTPILDFHYAARRLVVGGTVVIDDVALPAVPRPRPVSSRPTAALGARSAQPAVGGLPPGRRRRGHRGLVAAALGAVAVADPVRSWRGLPGTTPAAWPGGWSQAVATAVRSEPWLSTTSSSTR